MGNQDISSVYYVKKVKCFEILQQRVLYCYGIYQPLYGEIEREPLGVPTETGLVALWDKHHCNLVLLDDLFENVSASPEKESLFV